MTVISRSAAASVRLRTALLTAAALPLLVTNASAQCEDVAGEIVCSGSDIDGFASENDGVVLSVESDAFVDNLGAPALSLLGDGALIANDGSVFGTEADAVVVGTNALIENGGEILADRDAIVAEDADGLIVLNAGTISSGGEEGDKAINADGADDVLIDNTGFILGYDEAIEADDRAVVTNGIDGVIESAIEDGVQVQLDAEIVNDGTIYGGTTNGDGIDIDSGSITNTGLIEARSRGLAATADGAEAGIDIDDGNGSVAIVNDGTIRGEIAILEDADNTGGHLVTNTGLIEAVGGAAISFLGEGNDTVELVGGTVIGDILLGEGDDELFLLGGALVGEASLGSGDDLLVLSGALEAGTALTVDFGVGDDTADLAFDLDFLTDVAGTADDVLLSLMSGAGLTTVALRNVEGFEVAGQGRIDFATLFQLVTGDVIPLPGAVPLLLTGIGFLGAAARRRRSAG